MNLSVNSTVRVTDPSLASLNGRIGTIKVTDTSSLPYFVIGLYDDDPERGYWMRADQVEEVRDGETLTVSEPRPSEETGIISDLQQQVERLTTEVAIQKERAERSESRLREQQNHYSTDMRSIQNLMLEVKEEQDWCDDGWNSVVKRINDRLMGGWWFDEARRLVRKTVTVRGETTVDVEVWVYEDEDENDTDYWRDEEGDEIGDPDEHMQDALKAEFSRCGSSFDSVEVA